MRKPMRDILVDWLWVLAILAGLITVVAMWGRR